jgi:hypothetical protein
MGLKSFIKDIGHELNVAAGNEGKDKQYANSQTYPDREAASEALEKSKQKLFDVNGWSAMKGINSKFMLHDQHGQPVSGKPREGYYIKIELPGPAIENWVQIREIHDEADMAEFTVHPSEKPEEKSDPNAEVKHFFTKEASSTFRVSRTDNLIKAEEIGLNEVINNQGEESGNRTVLNTLIAEGGWAAFQKIQWDKLTKYLVHSDEVKTG